MGVLLLQFRKMNLIQEQNNIEYQLNDLNQKRLNYMSFAETLSNDSITIDDVAGMPASLFGAGVSALMSMNAQATQYANDVMSKMNADSVFNQFGNNAAQMQQIAYMKAFEQGREQLKKRLQAQLNQKEKEMDMKKARLEARQVAVDKELDNVSQRLAKDVEQSVCAFGLQA